MENKNLVIYKIMKSNSIQLIYMIC